MKSLLLRIGVLLLAITGSSIAIGTLISNDTYAQSAISSTSQALPMNLLAADPAQPPGEGEEEEEKPESSCTITGIGWIVCPIVRFMSNIVDAAYSVVSALLVVQPLLSTGEEIGTYRAWEIMRNFANVAFVVAFLIIIFSQVTSVGITNYGIKKMLPRLIISAILVNVSFWVCAIAVDLSNIVGASLKGLFDSVTNAVEVPAGELSVWSTGDSFWAEIASGVVATSAVAGAGLVALYVGLSALIPALLICFIAIVTVFVVLVVRQALIILLVVVSPLAFVAYLLPNTENMFNRWRSLFQTLLVMYPIIAALFGVSALASKVIMNGADSDIPGMTTAIQIAGATVAIAPLAITPLIMKSAGSLLGKVGAVMNQRSSGLRNAGAAYRDKRKNIMGARRLNGQNMFGEAGKRFQAKGSRVAEKGGRWNKLRGGVMGAAGSTMVSGSDSKLGQYVNQASTFGEVRKLTKEQQAANAQRAYSDAKTRYVAKNASGDDEAALTYAQTIAGPTGNADQVQANAVSMNRGIMAEEVKNAQIMARAEMTPGDVSGIGDKLAEAVRKNDVVQAQAMQNILMSSGGEGLKQYRQQLNNLGGRSDASIANDRTLSPEQKSQLVQQRDALMQNDASKELRRNFTENHSDKKAAAADLMAQATGKPVSEGGNGNVMANATASPNSWGLSDNEFSKQKGASLEAAYEAGALSGDSHKVQARKILADVDLSSNLDPTAKKVMEKISAGVSAGVTQGMVQGATNATQQMPTQQTGQLNVPHNAPTQPITRPNNPNFGGTNRPNQPPQ